MIQKDLKIRVVYHANGVPFGAPNEPITPDLFGSYVLEKGQYLVEFDEPLPYASYMDELSLVAPTAEFVSTGALLSSAAFRNKNPAAAYTATLAVFDRVSFSKDAKIATLLCFNAGEL